MSLPPLVFAFLLALLRWGRFFCSSLVRSSGGQVSSSHQGCEVLSPRLDPVVVGIPWQKLSRDLGRGAIFWCVSSRVSDLVFVFAFAFCFFFFGIRSAHFGRFFQGTCLSTVVTGLFQSSNFQPHPCWFFTLGTWPALAREVTPWFSACGSRFALHGAVGGSLVVLGSSSGLLLQRWSLVAARELHAPSPVTAFPRANPVWVSVMVFFFFFFPQSSYVNLKCYWTICWLRCQICPLLFVECA